MNELLNACISREGNTDGGHEVYNQIIEEANLAMEDGIDIEEVLFDFGFEPDYMFDLIEALTTTVS